MGATNWLLFTCHPCVIFPRQRRQQRDNRIRTKTSHWGSDSPSDRMAEKPKKNRQVLIRDQSGSHLPWAAVSRKTWKGASGLRLRDLTLHLPVVRMAGLVVKACSKAEPYRFFCPAFPENSALRPCTSLLLRVEGGAEILHVLHRHASSSQACFPPSRRAVRVHGDLCQREEGAAKPASRPVRIAADFRCQKHSGWRPDPKTTATGQGVQWWRRGTRLNGIPGTSGDLLLYQSGNRKYGATSPRSPQRGTCHHKVRRVAESQLTSPAMKAHDTADHTARK